MEPSWFYYDLYEDNIQPVCWRCAHVLTDDEFEVGDWCAHCQDCTGCYYCTG